MIQTHYSNTTHHRHLKHNTNTQPQGGRAEERTKTNDTACRAGDGEQTNERLTIKEYNNGESRTTLRKLLYPQK